MAVVEVSFGVDGFEVSGGDCLVVSGFDGDGFDPVNGVLEGEVWRLGGKSEDELVRKKGVFG